MSLKNLIKNSTEHIANPPGIFKAVSVFERTLLYISLLAIILISFTNVLMRNTGLGGLVWADRITINLVFFIAVLGSSLASSEKKHITIDLANNIMSGRLRSFASVVSDILATAASGFLVYFSVSLTVLEYREGLSILPGIGTWIPISIMPFGCAIIAVRYLMHAVNGCAALFRKEQD